MTLSKITTLALAGALTCSTEAAALAQGDSSALVDALVRKHVLTVQEGDDVRADMIKESASSDAGKISLSHSISQMNLYGDIRLRYQWGNNDPQLEPPPAYTVVRGRRVPTPGSVGTGIGQHGVQQSVFRFRLRLATDIKLNGGWFAGFGLQTNSASDSPNQTFGTGTNAPSAFGNYSIFIDRAFIGWSNDLFRVVGGKQSNPIYATDLTWGSIVNPDGFSESISFDKLFGGEQQTVSGYGKDGKAVVSVSATPEQRPWTLSLNLDQFILQTNNADAVGKDFNTDARLFEAQLLGSWKFNPTTKLTFGPAIAGETAANLIGPNNTVSFSNSGSAAVLRGATGDQLFIQAPGDLAFSVAGLKAKFLWDFSYNTKAVARDYREYNFSQHNGSVNGVQKVNEFSGADATAWLAGIQVGENKKRGDWSVIANYRQTGVASVDPNLTDPDSAFGFLNTQGVKVGVAYNVTDFAVAAVTFYDFWNLRRNLGLVENAAGVLISDGSEATSGNKIANLNAGQLLQIDLNVKF